jgi:A/G-specific adenine glycosylase
MRETDRAQGLLLWYDQHARDLPWRVSPADRRRGVLPDPYRVWLSEIMLQQTTVAAVTNYFHRFTTLWPNVTALAAAKDEDVLAEWAGLGYYARARNLIKCARIVANDHGGVFPDTHAALLALPGIGPYTAAAISAIAFDRPETVLDGNVERVMSRLFLVETPLPKAKGELTELAAKLTPKTRLGDYAQAVMDLGATICTPKSPACGICPWIDGCAARLANRQTEFPVKTPKKAKPTRYGIAYLARTPDGAWLLERRPERGLLGGMLGWPGTDWTEDAPTDAPPFPADWRDLNAEVRHTFTHFHLRLALKIATVDPFETDAGTFLPKHQFKPSALPTVMRKAFDFAATSTLDSKAG